MNRFARIAECLQSCEETARPYYDLKDVSAAVFRADRKSGLRPTAREEIFAAALEGKELTVYEESTQETDESPVLSM